MTDGWCSSRAVRSSTASGNRPWGGLVTPIAVRFMTPGLNLSRYERPLAERRLLDGAVRDRWESAGLAPTSSARPRKPLEWCGIMELSLAETRVSVVTRGTSTASLDAGDRGRGRVPGASDKGPGPRFASAPRMSVMFFLLERGAGRESGRPSDKLPEGLGSRNMPRQVSVTESRREAGTKEADLTGPGRNSKVGRVAPELQTKV